MIAEIIDEEVHRFGGLIPQQERETAEIYFREGMITAYTRMFNEALHAGKDLDYELQRNDT